MLGVVQEDFVEEEAPGSILSLCKGLLGSACNVKELLQASGNSEELDLDDQLEILQLCVEQALAALQQCKDRFKPMQSTSQKAEALNGAVQGIQQAVAGISAQRAKAGNQTLTAKLGGSSSFFSCCYGSRTAPLNGTVSPAGQRKFELALENLQNTVDLIKAVDTAGEDHFIFANWLPGLTPQADPFYKRPVAFDTVTTYLQSQKLPARILVHGPSGNGKTSLLRQIQSALTVTDHPLHDQFSSRFPGGLRWVDCGYPLRSSNPSFPLEVKQRALALAQDLLPLEDERLGQMDLQSLAAVIKEQLTQGSFIVVFDNVWDGSIFRRDCLDVLPEEAPGVEPKGLTLVTSQFNLSSICQWHSPETITIPLSAESNTSACISLLASLWSGDSTREDLPEHLEGIGRKLVKECNGSPLAVKLIAPLLEGSSKERKWKEVHTELLRLIQSLTFRRDSSAEKDTSASLPRVLYAFQLRARALPRAMRQMLSIFSIFSPSQQVPVAAVVHIFSQVCKRTLEEACVLLRGLANACYVDIRAPVGQILSGTVTYHGLLKQFLISTAEYSAVQLPGTATRSTEVCLALVVLYAAPAYQQQALQVFSKLRKEEDSMTWEQPTTARRNPFLEPFWLQLLSVLADGELGAAARVPVVGAARQVAGLMELVEALTVLFADPRTLLAAAGVFSELAWQIQDRSFLNYLATELEQIRALSRVIMRLRELTVQEGSMAQAEELAVLAWGFADLAEHVNDESRAKLRSEPVIPLLQTRYQGAAIYAYQRLTETLGL